jgi:hypothetical protein
MHVYYYITPKQIQSKQEMEKIPVFVWDNVTRVHTVSFYEKTRLARDNAFIQVTPNLCERLPTRIPGAPAYLLVHTSGCTQDFSPIFEVDIIASIMDRIFSKIAVARFLKPKVKHMKKFTKKVLTKSKLSRSSI